MQPGISKHLISILACRNIGSIQYINADIRKECYTEEHIIYVSFLIVPALIFWSIVIPILLLRQLMVN
jgi:hypothetical protein